MSIQSMPSMQGANPQLAVQNTALPTQRSAGANGPSAPEVEARAAADTAGTGEPKVDGKELASAIEKVKDFTQKLANELNFSVDEDSGQTVVKIVDTATQETIRQIPSKEMLAIAQALDRFQGLLIKQKA